MLTELKHTAKRYIRRSFGHGKAQDTCDRFLLTSKELILIKLNHLKSKEISKKTPAQSPPQHVLAAPWHEPRVITRACNRKQRPSCISLECSTTQETNQKQNKNNSNKREYNICKEKTTRSTPFNLQQLWQQTRTKTALTTGYYSCYLYITDTWAMGNRKVSALISGCIVI